MSIFNKTNGIELNQEDLNDAKSTAALFDDGLVKRRAFANVLAARSALKLLFSLNIDATNLYSMYSINKVLEDLDIADVYVGDIKIDARIVNDENEIFIPKSHFQLGIQPDLYLVLKLEKDLSGVEFLGCINPEEMDKTKENRDYYFVDEELLYNLKIFKNLIKSGKTTKTFIPQEDDTQRAENLIVPYEDNDIFSADKEFLLQQLAFNPELRKKAIEFENFEFVSKKVVTDETVYGDSVLGLVGTEKLYDRGEFKTDIDLDELSDATVDDFVESFKEEVPEVQDIEQAIDEVDIDDVLSEFSTDDTAEAIQNIDDVLNEFDSDDTSAEEPLAEPDYDGIDLDGNLSLEDSENSKMELENILSEMSDFATEDTPQPMVEEIIEEEHAEANDEEFSYAGEDSSENDTEEEFSFDNDEEVEAFDIPEDESQEELTAKPDFEENIESLPEINEDEDDDEDVEYVDFDPNAPIDLSEDGFSLDEIGGFSLDNPAETIQEDNSDMGFINTEDEPKIVEALQEDTSQTPTYTDDDDPDIAELPTLKIFEESPETYKKKMYKAPKIDDIDMKSINLDDIDDYEAEDKEKEEKENEEFDNMLSDIDNILTNDNIPIDSVDEILTDEELSESLKNLEDENKQIDANDYQNVEMEVSENSPTAQNNGETPTNESGMSLDDFLNSASFNEMSTKKNVGDNIEQNGIDTIYQDGSTQDTENMNQNSTENPETLLTDEAGIVDNSSSFYNEDPVAETAKAKPKPKSNAPMLSVVLVVLLCVFAYTRKDDIMQNFNFGGGAAEEEVPEFDLNKLKEPQPAPTEGQMADSPIPTIPQPTDMPTDTPPAPADAAAPINAPVQTTAGARPTPQATSNKITKLSWEVSDSMANNPKIRKYLQIAGRTLKLSLQNDLLVATELPFSNKVMVDLKIAPSGNLIMSDFIISSGSKQIDNIVLQSVKDTLKYVRPPLGEIQSPNSNFTLIINF